MAAPPFRVKAVYDYSSPHDDDLSFPNGQIINVTDEEDADWYYGEYTDSHGIPQQGLFPKNFVERYEPTTPPRPSRTARPKKETEPPVPSQLAASAAVPEAEEIVNSPVVSSPPPAPVPKEEEPISPTNAERSLPAPKPAPTPASEVSSSTTPAKPTAKPAPSGPVKAVPPPTAEKPSTGSFRDRIAAFNKPAAPPVAPMKPSGLGQSAGSSFVKKPYVAPPPSRNAYVPIPREPPPQKIYRREEDPEVASSNAEAASAANPPPASAVTGDPEEDQPKPTSLKDRIALLQKQQLEQAARHAEAVQKKEKPKRPPKRQTDPHTTAGAAGNDGEAENHERSRNEDSNRHQAEESSYDEHQLRARSSTRRGSKSKEATPLASPTRMYHNDPNDADQSGAGDTEDGGDVSTGREDDDEQPRAKIAAPSHRAPQLPTREPEVKAEEGDGGEGEDDENDEEEEEEEMDPEVRRKMEIRERMAKMSGGMGMAGMFGPPGGMPFLPKKPKTSGSSAREATHEHAPSGTDYTSSRNQPLMALPGMQQVRSPEEAERKLEVAKEEEQPVSTIGHSRDPDEVPDIENVEPEPSQRSRKPEERGVPPPVPQDRPLPIPPPGSRGGPPPIPSERPAPPVPPHFESRPVPPTASAMSPSEGSESDDEMSYPEQLALDTDVPSNDRPVSRGAPQMPPNMPGLPSRPQIPRSSASQQEVPKSEHAMGSTYPPVTNAPGSINNRSSRVPPIPGSSPLMSSPPQMRAPPPPLPPQAPPSRRTTESKNDVAPPTPQEEDSEEEEVTEYDGDYDTDMAPGATHKDALNFDAPGSSTDEPLTGDEAAYHHEGLPSLGPPPGPPPVPTAPPRGVPPPPPNQPPKHARQSSDMPRSAPPPPLPPKTPSYEKEEEEYDPYSYVAPRQATFSSTGSKTREEVAAPKAEKQYDELYDASPPQHYPTSPPPHGSSSFVQSPTLPASKPRQPLDILRAPSTRRSAEATRPSMEQGFIADDVDLGRGSQWWVQRKMPPPVFQARSDVTFEIEESNAIQQGGGQSTIKQVYVLFMDYSQTVISARFDAKDPSKVEFQQRHEPPPLGLRQDQLEGAHVKFGARIAEMANPKVNNIVGDGSPFALATELINAVQGALPPVGTRAYGALVYTNLANASVQQHDEIRAGDIISFRNAKLQGHRGPMKQKYNVEVGKPDHVAVVVDWDGTKKKVRAWEQGRESKKVKIESFKLGDLRSGEVKVWRVMAREWVGWGRGHS
ncbi:hypothetical protein MMC30_007393 [Trapelia coarctata]|nr:hypothetical protein [Trapelia coarctata]